ncbi:MAG: nucleoside hydrolase [Planctomycetes bacterium]|nr:nucleoside hydrolase [Planctomycetota bacterium]
MDRIVPEVPPSGDSLRLVIDTDFAAEIDDLYAVALALRSQGRFRLEGLVGTHFANEAGRVSIDESCSLLHEFLDVAQMAGNIPILRGGDPLRYLDEPSESEGADFIIDRAHTGSEADPLWVVGLGAASTLASAVMKDPDIKPLVRYVFHARSEVTWPDRSDQYNVYGDRQAARNLLTSGVPLVWFDTGTALTCPMETTERKLMGAGPLGRYLHEYRLRNRYFQRADKGFFDVGDIAWLIDPAVCSEEVVSAPVLGLDYRFVPSDNYGKIRRVFDVKPEPAWRIFFSRVGEADTD